MAGTQTAEILEAVRALEALNPTTDPAASPLVSGTWSLLFTGAADEATAAERRRREGAVGSAVTELTGAAGAASAASAPLLKGGDPTRARGGLLVLRRGWPVPSGCSCV
jgi:alkylhydroperoxidase family enzyme